MIHAVPNIIRSLLMIIDVSMCMMRSDFKRCLLIIVFSAVEFLSFSLERLKGFAVYFVMFRLRSDMGLVSDGLVMSHGRFGV